MGLGEAVSHNPRRAGMISSAQSRMEFKIFFLGEATGGDIEHELFRLD